VILRPWWERWPERLDWELKELEARGMRHAVHEADAARVLRIDVEHTIGGAEHALEARFPDLYPYFRPVVTMPTTFRYHQAVFGGQLCLIAREPRNWKTDDSLAALIETQLPKVLRANASDDQGAAAVEEPVPEPVSEAYGYVEPGVVLIDSVATFPQEPDHGTVEIALAQWGLPLRACVIQIAAPDGAILGAANPHLRSAHTAALVKQCPEIARPEWHGLGDAQVDVIVIVYTDEIRYTTYGDDFVVLLRVRSRDTSKATKRSSPSWSKPTPYLVRGMRAGADDLGARVPQLRSLATKKVAQIGLGALGGPAAMAFARAGIGRLAIDDPDVVEAGTISRWPMGLVAAGTSKARVVRDFIGICYPYTSVDAEIWRLGEVAHDVGRGDVAVLNRLLNDADLLFDATANIAVNHALSDIAWELGLPYVGVTATAGAWGGMVVRLEKGRTSCWSCLMAVLGTTITPAPADPDGHVAPVACSDITYTGAGFDLTPLADEAVRVGIGTLCRGDLGGYPEPNWDVETLALRAPDGSLIPPSWRSFSLPPNESCPTCGG